MHHCTALVSIHRIITIGDQTNYYHSFTMNLSLKRKPLNTEKVKKEEDYFGTFYYWYHNGNGTELKDKKTNELSVLKISVFVNCSSSLPNSLPVCDKNLENEKVMVHYDILFSYLII